MLNNQMIILFFLHVLTSLACFATFGKEKDYTIYHD